VIPIGKNSAIPRTSSQWLILAFTCVILLQFELVINRPVNWDEFFHLSEAHAFAQGRLTEALQVFYARAFFWLPMLPVDAVDQIRVARMFMFGCELFTAYAIYAMAKSLVDDSPAALAALTYLATGYVFQHGFSYRADPMAAAFLMGAAWTLLSSKVDVRDILIAALLAALATLTTIKVIFYAPVFAGITWLRWVEAEDRRDMALRLSAFAGLAILLALVLIAATILSLPEASTDSTAKTVSTSGSMMFDEGLFPRWPYAIHAMILAPLTTLFIVRTPLELRRISLPRSRQILLTALLLPLTSLIFYRNSFPYFYVYILPPVMVAAAIAVKATLVRSSLGFLSFVLIINAATISLATPRGVLLAQKQVLTAAREIFPEPVAYFDFPGMLVDFPKANFFMTTWGVRKYRAGIEPSFVEAMSHEVVPLLVVNQEPLERNQTSPTPAWELLPDDAVALREGFIPHWGPFWVAGRRFSPETKGQTFTIYTPGVYTLEGAPARIDEHIYKAGETIMLRRGTHRFENNGDGPAILRWGNHLKTPDYPFMGGPIFKDF